MNTQLAYPLGFSRYNNFRDYYRLPQLPDKDCKELQRYPWNRPILMPVIATLLNLPCASALQLASLTGIPVDQIEAELRAASQATASTPRLVAPIGRNASKENIHPELARFMGDDELWAIAPPGLPKAAEDAPPQLLEAGVGQKFFSPTTCLRRVSRAYRLSYD